jgi:tetratricopeptide (TPR) repeat protein
MSSRFEKLALPLLVALALAPLATAAPDGLRDPQLAPVQARIESGDAAGALELLEKVMKQGKPSAEALLLRSTALIMAGDTPKGFKDLERALDIDPTLRQGWLNLAGLEIAEQRYGAAYEALEKARELAPDEPDNHLNMGAVLALQGKVDAASEHFDRYVEMSSGSAQSHYLVATNYALAGRELEAVAHLKRAVELDERVRLRARSDERFLALDSAEYRKLLATDVYEPPAGAHVAASAFNESYRRKDPKLVYAVLDALKVRGLPYDPTIEANEEWALIWTPDMRIKLFTQHDGAGVVRITAPRESFTDDQWAERTESLFRSIYEILAQGAKTLRRER